MRALLVSYGLAFTVEGRHALGTCSFEKVRSVTKMPSCLAVAHALLHPAPDYADEVAGLMADLVGVIRDGSNSNLSSNLS